MVVDVFAPAMVPPEVHANTGRLRSAGSRCLPGPRRLRYYAALRLLFPVGRRSGCPLRLAYHLEALVLDHDAGALRPASCRRVVTGPPSLRMSRWRYEASQVPGPSSCQRAAIPNPAPCAAILPTDDRGAAAFEVQNPLGSGKALISRPTHAAHGLACLRIAGHLAVPSQGSLPACRARLWPDGFRARWTTNTISGVPLISFPRDQPYLVASLNRAFRSPQEVVSVGTDWPAKGLYKTVAPICGLSAWSMIQDRMVASSVVPQ